MGVRVNVEFEGSERPRVGAPVRIEARDISIADARPDIVGSAVSQVLARSDSRLTTVDVDLDRRPDLGTIWVHVDVSGDGRVSKGDFVTMESYPIPSADEADLTVRVRRV